MFDDSQIDKLADDLIEQVAFAPCLGNFVWKGEALQPAWATRRALASTGFADSVEDYAERVHRWGFGASVRAAVRQHASFSPAMRTLCASWSRPDPWNRQETIDNLIDLLDIKYLGIARVSKFICFLDQERYAIYDSRVSYALKDLTLDGSSRVFPFIGGRPPTGARYVLPDFIAGKPRHVALAYVGFLQLLQRVADKLNEKGGITDETLRQAVGKRWTPALLEMALFMAGQNRRQTAAMPGLDTQLWNRLDKAMPTRRTTAPLGPSQASPGPI